MLIAKQLVIIHLILYILIENPAEMPAEVA